MGSMVTDSSAPGLSPKARSYTMNVAMGGGAQADIIQNRYLQLAVLIFYLIISFPIQTKS